MEITAFFKDINSESTDYYFVFKPGTKHRLYVFLLSLNSIPFMIIGGKRAFKLYNTALEGLNELLGVKEVEIDDIRFFDTSPDVGEIVLIWLISQLTVKNPDKELLLAILRFGVPVSIKALRDDLYRKSQSLFILSKKKPKALISIKLAIKLSSSFRKILNELVMP